MNEIKSKIPNTANVATTTAVPAVENKVPNVSNLVKKPNDNPKASGIKKYYY